MTTKMPLSNGYDSRVVRRELRQRRNVLLLKVGLGLLAVVALGEVAIVMT